MTAPARKLEHVPDVLIPGPRPDAANDNFRRADIASYVRDVRSQSGAAYQGSNAKLWWVP